MGVGSHAQTASASGKRPDNLCTGGWVGARAGLNGCRKSRVWTISLPSEVDPQTVQLVARRYTDYVTPAHSYSAIIYRAIKQSLCT